ncbi:hypothetical protein SVIOM342S_08716 [Streptomyces violaceorubidus]
MAALLVKASVPCAPGGVCPVDAAPSGAVEVGGGRLGWCP